MRSFGNIDFCLLIPCYNNIDGLIASLESVEYDPGKYLIVVVDDGSREMVRPEHVSARIKTEKPVVILRNEKNLGITATLNRGLGWIESQTDAKYIARLDCGDICDSKRFVKQVACMDQHPGVGLLGSWCKIVDKATSFNYSYKATPGSKAIRKAMYFRNVFMHATVMFRGSLLKTTGYYPTNFEYAEDYAFFWKLMNVSEVMMQDEFLVVCELNKSGISYKNKSKQLMARARVVSTFGKSIALKFAAYVRLLLLFILPKRITLRLKKWKG